MRARTQPVIIDVDMTALGDVLKRARLTLSPEDHACLESVVQTFLSLSRLVRERGTTIARLRRLFGLVSSEKTRDVLGTEPPAQSAPEGPQPEMSAAADATAGETNSDVPSIATDETKDGAAAAEEKPKRLRKGHGRIAAAEYALTPVLVEHERLHAGDVCPCCAHGKLHRLRDPARIVRIIGRAPLAALAWDCTSVRCGGCGKVFTARAPAEAQGPKYDESAVSMMAVLRYAAGMPLHRLARLQRNFETPVPASTQWEVVRDHVAALQPVYAELRRQAAQGRVIHNDDTSIRILALMGKRRARMLVAGELPDPDRTGLFTTAIVAIADTGPIALFCSGRKHAGENLALLLAARDPALAPPIQMCDGLDRNLPANHSVLESNCLAHGRRHVVDEFANFPTECRHVLEALAKVFENESYCRAHSLRGQDRLELHQRESGRVMADLEVWLKAQLDEKRVEPNSGLGEAFRYLLKRWRKLTLFLRVPNAPLENNSCERALKMAIRQRNNSLFYRTEHGAKVGDVYMTLIHTAELHGQNPFDYLTALLEHEADVAADPKRWLPWNYPNARARSAARARASPDAAA
jgi:transposase